MLKGVKTLLICTDFSEAATHAARYACILARQYGFGYITLFNTYHTVVTSTALPLNTNEDDEQNTNEDDEQAKASLQQLQSLKDELAGLTGDDMIIRVRTEKLSLGEKINEICREENSDMVVLGITGKSKLEKTFIGSSAVNVSKNCAYPVLIVPAKAPLEPVQSILFACDLNEIAATNSS
ncbi:MAG TPA: universal stress protein [Chitinophagaceae bacterium]|nr:universal stress protein [Chitinophagaceae bacterium]